MATNSFSETDKIFHSDGYRLGQTWAEKGTNPVSLVDGQRELYHSVDGLIDSLLRQAERFGKKAECARSCSWCCYQPVFANSLEINCLGEYIRSNFSTALMEETARKTSRKNSHVSVMKESEMLHHKSPCPLLNDGACMAYEVRPMACRIYLSTSLSSCLNFYIDPGHPESYPALLEFPLRAGRMLNEGFTAAFRQNGFKIKEYRLEEGLDRFFNNHPC
jgi:Fe-S-cluster containining protein